MGVPALEFAQFCPAGYTNGTANNATITARKEILVTTLFDLCSIFSIFDTRMDMPIDYNIKIEIAPNTSNLTNAELK